MTGLAGFCVATVLLLAFRDLFVAEAREVEVWFGLELRGGAALATAPLHWAIFALGAWAFWTQRPWILPAAAGYAFYVAASHLVWSALSPEGWGLRAGFGLALLFAAPGFVLLGLHRRTRRDGAGG